jgi:hypothetical protein
MAFYASPCVSKIDLSLSRRMFEGDEDFLILLGKASYSLPDSRIGPLITIFISKPFPDTLGCVSLFVVNFEIILKDLLNPILKRTNFGTFTRFG